jgi:hypothetical protein
MGWDKEDTYKLMGWDKLSAIYAQGGGGGGGWYGQPSTMTIYAQGGGGSTTVTTGTGAAGQGASIPAGFGYNQGPVDPTPPFPMVQSPGSEPLQPPTQPGQPPTDQQTPPGASPSSSQTLARYQAGLEWLRPPGASQGPQTPQAQAPAPVQEEFNLSAAADAFLRTGSIPAPGQEVNMDTIFKEARSRDFTPAEQDEMVREGEVEGVRASNLHMLRLQGSMYEELERQLQDDDQSEAAANALWW